MTHLRESSDQSADGDLGLQSCKGGAETEVDAIAEPQMAPRVRPSQVELIRIIEHRRIAVGRHHPQEHGLAGLERLATTLMRLGDHTNHDLRRTVEAVQFLHRLANEVWCIDESTTLVRV